MLKATIAGAPLELVSTEVHGTGELENLKEASGEPYIHIHGIVLTYKNVTVINLPNCHVVDTKGGVAGTTGTITTNKLTATTAGKGDAITLTPEGGLPFAEFHIGGTKLADCPFALTPEVLKITVTGSLTCIPEGATINCNHSEVTASKSLRLNNAITGPVAGLEGKVTVTGSAKEEAEGTTKPLSVTTVEPAKGTTAFTCTSGAPRLDFKSEHCKPGEGGTSFGHKEIPEGTLTHTRASNEKTTEATTGAVPSILKSTVAGAALELIATEIEGTGSVENLQDAGVKEHYIHVKEVELTYRNVRVNSFPSCHVVDTKGGVSGETGVIHSNKMTATSTGKGDAITFTPEGGKPFAEFHVSGVNLAECPFALTPEVLKVTVVGSLTCKPDGATINCNHAESTASKTLRLNNPTFGPVAGLEGKVTVTGSGKEEAEGTTKPISVTTVETA